MPDLDDLHRPLGKKGPEEDRSGGGSPAVTRIIAVLALLAGVGAVLLLAIDRFAPGAGTGQPGVATGQPADGQGNGGDQPGGETTPASTEGTAVGSAQTGQDGDGQLVTGDGDGMRELVPDGAIAIPEPRPPRAAPQERGLAHLPEPGLVEEGPSGPLPVRSEDGRRPMDVYARPPDTTGNFGVARIVLIIGGIGISQTSSQQAINELPPSVTLAFAPYGNSLGRWMQAARKQGHELLLQVPMEPFGYPQTTPGRNTTTVEEMVRGDLSSLHWAMGRITNYVGIMNYQGGRLLGEREALANLFDEVAQRGLLFVDDGTANGSLSGQLAPDSLLAHARVGIQIDAIRTRQAIAERLGELEQEAKRTGLAIGMGNAFAETIALVSEFVRDAGRRGVEITPVSAVVEDPERER